MSDLTTLARPYAKAVFDFAVEETVKSNDALDKWAIMLQFLSQLTTEETIQTYLQNAQSPVKQAETIIDLCGNDLDQYGQNLVRIMAENKRLLALGAVYEEYCRLVADYRAVANVNVFSAYELTARQQQKIISAMEKRLARKIKLNCSVEPSLLGGLVIRTDDFVIDASTKGQLQRLATDLQL